MLATLKEIRIRNFSLIEDVKIDLASGLNIVTGETGAGKTIFVHALEVLLGGKISTDDIRAGTDVATVEGYFEVADNLANHIANRWGICFEQNELFLKRTITRDGRSRAWVNASPVPIKVLREIGETICDFHGQHTHQSLLDPRNHLLFLDAFLDIEAKRMQLTQIWEEWVKHRRELDNLLNRLSDMREKADFYKFEIERLEKLNLHEGEEEELASRIKLLENSEAIASLVNELYDLLYAGEEAVLDKINQIIKKWSSLQQYVDGADKYLSQLESMLYELEDIVPFLENIKSNIEYSPDELDALRNRYMELQEAKRRYGKSSVKELLEYYERLKQELASLDLGELEVDKLRQREHKLRKEVERLADEISELRRAGKHQLEQKVEAELHALGMPNARFRVKIEPKEIDATGKDKVEFLFSANPGEPLGPLRKIASGGELSRTMLALKSILAERDTIPILVFDEIDTGVSGRIADIVGERMDKLADSHQIICITHLPQIASKGERHFKVWKEVTEGRTCTRLAPLSDDERIREIAYLLAGKEISDTALQHAKALLKGGDK